MRIWTAIRCSGVLYLLSVLHAAAQDTATVTRYVTADNSIIDVAGERDFNMGRVTSIRLKAFQHHVILKFDLSGLSNRVITAASLYCFESNTDDLNHVTVSTIQGDWQEGDSAGFATSEGGACFNYAAYSAVESNRVAWAWPGSRFPDVAYGNSFSLVDHAYTHAGTTNGQAYYRWDIAPDLVAANVAGAAYGLAVFESSRVLNQNRTVYSREDSNPARRPYLLITSAPDTTTPSAVANLTASTQDVDRGEVRLSWTVPPGAFAYRIRAAGGKFTGTVDVPRHLIPYAGPPGSTESVVIRDILEGGQQHSFTVHALSRGGNTSAPAGVSAIACGIEAIPGRNVNVPDPLASVSNGYETAGLRVWAVPETEKVLPDGTFLPLDKATALPKTGNPVFDGQSVKLSAARNETVAFILGLEAVSGPVSNLHVTVGSPPADVTGRLSRIGYIHTDQGDMPEIMYPSPGALATDMDENAVGQRVQQVLVELLVSPQTAPGDHVLSLAVTNNTGVSISLPVLLHVWRFALPDKPFFTLEMNDYGYPVYQATFNELQRLSHDDRAHVNLVPYGPSRTRMDMHLPPPTSRYMNEAAYNDIAPGATTTFWDDFALGFDPALSGALFTNAVLTNLPPQGFYLTFHESWPLPYDSYYAAGEMDAAVAFTNHPEYAQTFVNLLSNFLALAEARDWTRAGFQVYFNNKQHPWDFDEPYDFWDFRALAWYAGLFDQGTAHNHGVNIRYRIDISRPQYHRNVLRGKVDLAVVGRDLLTFPRLTREAAFGEQTDLWNYGTAAGVHESNHNEEAWPLLAYAYGARGVLPWSTVKYGARFLAGVTGSDEQQRALYVVKTDGETPEAYGTLRMKAFRRGAQDVEYLELARLKGHLTRGQMTRMVLDAIGGSATVKLNPDYAEDAGTLVFTNLSEAVFFTLRHKAARIVEGTSRPSVGIRNASAGDATLVLDNLYDPSTCTVERASQLVSNGWQAVDSFPVRGHATNWLCFLSTNRDPAFFRFRLSGVD